MKRIYALIVALVCATTVLAGCGKGEPTLSEQKEVEEGVPVEVTAVEVGVIENEYMYSGTIKAAKEIDVPTLISGKIASVNFEVGDRVKAGDVLFTMDTKDIQDNINTLVASVEAATASVNSAQTSLNLVNGAAMETQIENAKTGVENTKLNLNNTEIVLNKAEIDYENNKVLYESGIISKEIYQQYKNGYSQAQIAYQQAQLAHEQAVKTYDITKNKMPAENRKKAEDGLKVAQASRKSAQAQLESARSKLKDAIVTSPISGVVSVSHVKQGEFLAMGAVVPMTIIDNSNVMIEVGLSEGVINNVQIGDLTKVLVKSVSADYMEGKITSIEPAAKQDNTYGVKIQIENQAGMLKPGMFGEVYFSGEKSQDTMIIPRNAVLEDLEGFYVFIEEEGIAKKVDVTLGIEKEEKVEVISGLSPTMNVVTLGQNYIEDGDLLMITSAGKEE